MPPVHTAAGGREPGTRGDSTPVVVVPRLGQRSHDLSRSRRPFPAGGLRPRRLAADVAKVKSPLQLQAGLSKDLMAHSAAAMFGAAGLVGLIEAFTSGGPDTPLLPGFAAFAIAAFLLALGRRLPTAAMAALGPLGVVLIGLSLSTNTGPGDGALLYIWPVLWQTYFFGRRGAILIAVWVGLVHALVLISLPAGVGYLDRWIDVMASVLVVVTVVEVLAERNRRLVAQLAEEAQVDKLTGLLNRRGFEKRAELELARARRDHLSLAAVAFDLDLFKHVNDEFGHEVGDQALAHLGEIFRAEMRDTDVLARVGGEEFVALLPNAEIGDAAAFAERVRAAMQVAGGAALPTVTVSAGAAVASAPEHLEPLLRSADIALYEAKFAGRNQTVVAGRSFGRTDSCAVKIAGAQQPHRGDQN